MASYISKYTGKQIDGIIELFKGKGLNDVIGVIQRNSDGNFSAKTISWSDVESTKPTTLEGYGITDAVPTSMIETVTTDSNDKISTSKAMKTYVDTYGGKIDTISVNGTPQTIINKNVDLIVATLENGKVPESQLPSYVDDVLEFANRSAFPVDGEAGKIYVALDTNLTYRWSGSEYVEISQSLALGETSSTAYQGDRGKIAYDHAVAKGSQFASGLYKIGTNSEGHVITATAVQNGVDIKTINGQNVLGSGNLVVNGNVEDVTIDGTSVVTNKIAQIDLSGKQDKLIDTQTADQNIKTINGISILGSGDIDLYCYIFPNQTRFAKLVNAYYYSSAFYCVDDNYNTYSPSVYATKDSDFHVASLKFQYQEGETLHSWTVDNSDTWTIETTTNLQPKLIGTQTTGQNIKTINGDSLLGSGDLIIGGNVDDVTVDGTSVVSNKIAAISLSSKQDTLVSGTNIKTINGESLLGSGNIEVGGGGVSVQSDWTETDTSSAAYIKNKPTLSTVATSGNYNDLTNKPTLSTVATTGAYNDLSGKPTFSAVATTGSYNDLTDKPTIPPQLTAGTGITIDSNNVISVNLVNAETQSF